MRVLPGPHQDFFAAEALDGPPGVAVPDRSTIGSHGIPSRGRAAGARHCGTEMISDATPMGALQVPASGQPILLMADRQTTGGYPTIATVITADLGLAGQLAPGDSIAFVVCSPAEAMAALIARERRILAVARPEPRMIDAGELLADRFGRDRVRRDVGARAVHHVQGRRSGRLAHRDPQQRRGRRRAAACARGRPAGYGARRRFERAGVGRGRPRTGDSYARRSRSSRSHQVCVRADAAVSINGLVRWTIHHGCAGLEAWAGTPGTVGGAIFGNAHFSGRLIGDLVESVRVASREGARRGSSPATEMAFGYDRSRLQRTGEVLLSATFRVGAGEPAALRATARESLAFRKRTQPLDTRNAGCVFQNPDPARDRVPEGIPWSAGALVDRAGLKGAVGRRRAGIAGARQLHRQRGRRHRVRDSAAHRPLPGRGPRPLRRRAAGRDRLCRRRSMMPART